MDCVWVYKGEEIIEDIRWDLIDIYNIFRIGQITRGKIQGGNGLEIWEWSRSVLQKENYISSPMYIHNVYGCVAAKNYENCGNSCVEICMQILVWLTKWRQLKLYFYFYIECKGKDR